MSAAAAELVAIEEEMLRRAIMAHPRNFVRRVKLPSVPALDTEDGAYPLLCEYVAPAEHHDLIIDALYSATRGGCPNVMLFLPPGSAKSTYSNAFIAWFLAARPGSAAIHVTYATPLAEKMARRIRAVCASPEYAALTTTGLTEGHAAVLDWGLRNGSTYMGGGVMSGVTGNRADLLVIDDPFKGREEADSPTIRAKVWAEYNDSLLTRKKPGAVEVVIMTRWHPDDLAGRILGESWNGESGIVRGADGTPWNVICIPAEADRDDDPLGRERGEWLWTEWFGGTYWEDIKRRQPARTWCSLYQQRPTIDGGNLLRKEWIKYYDHMPPYNYCVWSWDTAGSDKDHADYSVGTLWGIRPEGYYLLYVHREKMLYPELEDKVYKLATETRADKILIEDKGTGSTLLQRLSATRRAPLVAIKPRNISGRKVIDWMAATEQFESGNVFLPRHASFLSAYEGELLNFPAATNDDQVDSTSQFLNWAKDNLKDEITDNDPYEDDGGQQSSRGVRVC